MYKYYLTYKERIVSAVSLTLVRRISMTCGPKNILIPSSVITLQYPTCGPLFMPSSPSAARWSQAAGFIGRLPSDVLVMKIKRDTVYWIRESPAGTKATFNSQSMHIFGQFPQYHAFSQPVHDYGLWKEKEKKLLIVGAVHRKGSKSKLDRLFISLN